MKDFVTHNRKMFLGYNGRYIDNCDLTFVLFSNIVNIICLSNICYRWNNETNGLSYQAIHPHMQNYQPVLLPPIKIDLWF